MPTGIYPRGMQLNLRGVSHSDYSEAYVALKRKVKEYPEVMEVRSYEEGAKLAVEMFDLVAEILSVSSRLHLQQLERKDDGSRTGSKSDIEEEKENTEGKGI